MTTNPIPVPPTTGDELLALRRDAIAAYEEACRYRITRPGAFGLGAHMIQLRLAVEFRVACMLMDCWSAEVDCKPKPPP